MKGDSGRHDADKERHPRAVDDAGHHVPAQHVRPEQMLRPVSRPQERPGHHFPRALRIEQVREYRHRYDDHKDPESDYCQHVAAVTAPELGQPPHGSANLDTRVEPCIEEIDR